MKAKVGSKNCKESLGSCRASLHQPSLQLFRITYNQLLLRDQKVTMPGSSISPAIDLEPAEIAPPGHDAKDEQDAGRKQGHPTDADACNCAQSRIERYDGACTHTHI
jgi:hypothetical protein